LVSVRIRVRNFQSIEDAEIEVSGFTVVTGQNNSGKTALMRAVRGVFENSGGDAFVRYGTDVLAVHLEFDDAEVTWTKGPKVKPTYVVGGKTINPGRSVPAEVASLGIVPVQAGSGEAWPQIAPQFTGQVFLLDLPGSAIAEVVSDVDRVSKLTEALRYAESDKRSANTDLKLRRKDRDEAQAEVQRFDGLDAAAVVYDAAARSLSDAQDASTNLEDVRVVAERLRTSASRVAALAGVSSVSVPSPDDARSVASDVMDVRRIASAVRRYRDAVSALPKDVPVPSSQNAAAVAADVATATRLRSRLRAARDTVVSLPSGVTVPDATSVAAFSTDVSTTRGIVRRLSAARASVSRYEGAAGVVPDPSTANKVGSAINVLKDMRNRIETARAAAQLLEYQLKDAIKSRESAQGELDTVIVEVGACPTCGSTATGDGYINTKPGGIQHGRDGLD
jgi:energy-coupling factor transporter ATP-binding protein EcfA2